VTLETFTEWKRRKAERKQKELEDRMKEEAKKGSKGSNILSGRALFKYDPTLFQDDEAAADSAVYEERAEDEEDAPAKEEVESEGEESKRAEEVDKELFQQQEGQEEEPDFD